MNVRIGLNVFFANLIIIMIVMKPTPVSMLGALGIKLFDVVIILTATIWLATLLSQRRQVSNKSLLVLGVVALFPVIDIVSTLLAATRRDISLVEFVEFTRWIGYFPLLLVGMLLSRSEINDCYKAYHRTVILFSLFSWLLFLNFFGFEAQASILYDLSKSRGTENLASDDGLWRLASTFSNPNYFGFFCAINAASYIYLTIKKEVGLLVGGGLSVSMALFTLLSGSRTALICMLALFFLIYIFLLYKNRNKKLFIVVFYLSLAVGGAGLYLGIQYIYELFWRFSNVENMRLNFDARFTAWQQLSVLKDDVLVLMLGYGSEKENFLTADNNYVAILLKNGIVGLLIFIGLLAIITRRVFYELKLRREESLPYVFIFATITMMISSLTAVPFQHMQLASLYLFLLGMFFSRKWILK